MSQLKQAQCEELLYLLKKILPAATRMPHHGIFCKAGKKHDPAKDSPQCTCAHSAFAAIQRAEEILATPPVVQMGAYAITADDEPKRDCACGISGLSPADHLWDCPVRLHAEKVAYAKALLQEARELALKGKMVPRGDKGTGFEQGYETAMSEMYREIDAMIARVK